MASNGSKFLEWSGGSAPAAQPAQSQNHSYVQWANAPAAPVAAPQVQQNSSANSILGYLKNILSSGKQAVSNEINTVKNNRGSFADFVKSLGITGFNQLTQPGVAGGDLAPGASPFDKNTPSVPVSSHGSARDAFLQNVQTGGKNNLATQLGQFGGSLASFNPVGAGIAGGNKLSEQSIESPGTAKQKVLRGAGVLTEAALNGLLGSKTGHTLLNPGEGNLASKVATGAAKNLPFGYGLDVAQNLQQDKTGKQIFKPGMNTLLMPGIGGASELAGAGLGKLGSLLKKDAEGKVTMPTEHLTSYEGAPDKTTVETYKERIKAGEKLDPIVVREDSSGNIGVEDGKHRLEAYKQLGIKDVPVTVDTSAKTVEAPKPEPVAKVAEPVKQSVPSVNKGVVTPGTETVTVPKSQLPVGGSGETKVSGLAARVSDKLGSITPEERAKLPEYEAMTHKDQLQKAAAFVEKSPEEAIAVLKGEKAAPDGILHGSIFLGLEEKAMQSGDAQLIRDLASLRATRAGQELSILAARDPNSPVKYLSEVRDSRIEIKGGAEKVKAKVKQTVKEGLDVIKQAAPKKEDWASFVESIRC